MCHSTDDKPSSAAENSSVQGDGKGSYKLERAMTVPNGAAIRGDVVSCMPVELLKIVFEETAAIAAGRYLKKPFTNSYVHQSILLSHVSRHWRRVAISVPSLWSIFSHMHPDAMSAFIVRGRSMGLYVKICDYDMEYILPGGFFYHYPKAVNDALLEGLAEDLPAIKYLEVDLHDEDMVCKVLTLGRGVVMEKLTEIKAVWTINQLAEVPATATFEKASHIVMDWDMPVVSRIVCKNIWPCPAPTESAPNITLEVRGDVFCVIPLSQMGYEHLTRVVVMPSHTQSSEKTQIMLGEQIADDIFILPRLQFLHLSLRDTGDPTSINHTAVFNRLRFPQLDELQLLLSPSLARYPLLSEPLRSMKNLTKMSIIYFSSLENLRDFFDDRIFPHLQQLRVFAAEFTPQTAQRLKSLDAPPVRFPVSLEILRFERCTGEALKEVSEVLLLALHRQFSGKCGQEMWITCDGHPFDKEDMEDRLGHDVIQRLTLIQDLRPLDQ